MNAVAVFASVAGVDIDLREFADLDRRDAAHLALRFVDDLSDIETLSELAELGLEVALAHEAPSTV